MNKTAFRTIENNDIYSKNINKTRQRQTKNLEIPYNTKSYIDKINQSKHQQLEQTNLSKTQKQLLSHSLIKKVLNNCRLKSVNYDLKNFHPKFQLYKRYSLGKTQEKSNTIDTDHHQSFLECSKQVKTIVTEIQNQSALLKFKNSFSNKNNTLEPYNHNNTHISMTGLINYRFKSVASKSRLTLGLEEDDQNIKQQLQNIRKKNNSSNIRNQKIKCRTDPSQSINRHSFDHSILSTDEITTSQYLKKLIQQKQLSKKVFGVGETDVVCLKKMKQQVNDLDDAWIIVDNLKQKNIKGHPRNERKKIKKSLGIQPEQLISFKKRRLPYSKKKIQIYSAITDE